MNRIGMHVQNREFKNTGFLPIWVFDSQELEDHSMQRSMVRLSKTTSVQPLWRSHVDLSVIWSAGEDAPADFAVGGGEEDLRHLEMEPEVLLRCDGGFRRWSSSGELYDAEAKAGQERQRTTSTGVEF